MEPAAYFLIVYAIGMFIGGILTAFITGTKDSTDVPADGADISVGIGMSCFWPLVLALFIIYVPFYGVYKLGQLYGRRP